MKNDCMYNSNQHKCAFQATTDRSFTFWLQHLSLHISKFQAIFLHYGTTYSF